MSISELIVACQRRLSYLQSVRGSAVSLGDMVQIDRVDTEILQTQETLNKLQTVE